MTSHPSHDTALTWVGDATDSTIERGDRLEQFTAWVAIPRLYPEATDIEWLGHGVDSLAAGQDRADVAFRLHGERFFVQCKNYTDPLGEADAERYITAFNRRKVSGGYDGLVIVAAGGFSLAAATALTEVGATMMGPETLAEVDCELSEFLSLAAAATPAPTVPAAKVPFPHNAEAIEAIVGFDGPRGCVFRATGSGKTVVQAAVINALDPRSVLVAVPSIELTRQLIMSYAADTVCRRFLAVFSGRLPADVAALAGGVPATTDPEVVAEFLARPGKSVIVSTYQSIPDVVMPAAVGHRFDLGLFDEAHRMATSNGSTFATALDDTNIDVARRVFFTATPKVTSTGLREKVDALDADLAVTIHSMDDTATFGPEIPATRLTLTEAIERDIVAPFDLVIGVMDDEMLRNTLVYATEGRRQVNHYTDRFGDPDDRDTWVTVSDVAQALLVLSELSPGQSALTFHASIERAQRSARLIEALAEDSDRKVVVMSVDGTASMRRRRAAIKLLQVKDPDAIHIVTNCQLFGEGVDIKLPPREAEGLVVPNSTLDAVAFFDPRQSTIGIAQAIGRALRRYPDKRAKVIVPLFAGDEDPVEFVKNSRYGNLYTIAAALRDADVILPEFIHEYRDYASPITTRVAAKHPGVHVTLPTAYDHIALRESIRGLVLRGETKVRLSEDKAFELLTEYLALHGQLDTRDPDDDARFILRQCAAWLPEDKKFPDVVVDGGAS